MRIVMGLGAAIAALAVALFFAQPSMTEETAPAPTPQATARVIFAGGCFWCMEPPFDGIEGVISTVSGYSGGAKDKPTYEEVSSGSTGHAEVVEVTYDPAKVSFENLLFVFWRNVDPLDSGGQFCDRGSQYRTAIFVTTDEQLRLAQESKAALEASGRFERPIVTEIAKAGAFYPAEGYHQDYYRHNPIKYKIYRAGCGRDARLDELWGDEAGGGKPHS
jgi:peptide-methionine (S)-S-oxide reductase